MRFTSVDRARRRRSSRSTARRFRTTCSRRSCSAISAVRSPVRSRRTPARSRSANKGTLFLDEIGEMPANMQAKLLRVLETSEVQRVGSTERKKVNFRLVTATNRNLEKEVKDGRFREDLYYRIRSIRFTSRRFASVRRHPADRHPSPVRDRRSRESTYAAPDLGGAREAAHVFVAGQRSRARQHAGACGPARREQRDRRRAHRVAPSLPIGAARRRTIGAGVVSRREAEVRARLLLAADADRGRQHLARGEARSQDAQGSLRRAQAPRPRRVIVPPSCSSPPAAPRRGGLPGANTGSKSRRSSASANSRRNWPASACSPCSASSPGSLAHESKQRLQAILSNAQAALRFLNHDRADVDEVRASLKDIAELYHRATEIIRRMMAMMKKGEVQMQPGGDHRRHSAAKAACSDSGPPRATSPSPRNFCPDPAGAWRPHPAPASAAQSHRERLRRDAGHLRRSPPAHHDGTRRRRYGARSATDRGPGRRAGASFTNLHRLLFHQVQRPRHGARHLRRNSITATVVSSGPKTIPITARHSTSR